MLPQVLRRPRRSPTRIEPFEPRPVPDTYVAARPLLHTPNGADLYGGRATVSRRLVDRAAARLAVQLPDWRDRVQPHIMRLEVCSAERCVLAYAFHELDPVYAYRTGMHVLYGIRPGEVTPPSLVPGLPADALAFTGSVDTRYWLDYIEETA